MDGVLSAKLISVLVFGWCRVALLLVSCAIVMWLVHPNGGWRWIKARVRLAIVNTNGLPLSLWHGFLSYLDVPLRVLSISAPNVTMMDASARVLGLP